MIRVTDYVFKLVYEWIGIAFLRRARINLDALWSIALAARGVYMLVTWRAARSSEHQSKSSSNGYG